MTKANQPKRVFDREQAIRSLNTLEATVAKYRATHRSDDGIRARLARIYALRSMLNKPVIEEELV